MAGLEGQDRTFNLGLTITMPPDQAQVSPPPNPSIPSDAGPTSPTSSKPDPKKRMSKRQRKKSTDQLSATGSAASPQNPASPTGKEPPVKRSSWLKRLFSKNDKTPAKAGPPQQSTLSVSSNPQQQQVESVLKSPTGVSPSPRLTSKLRPSASADANLSSLATSRGGMGQHQTTAEVTPGATTEDGELFIEDGEGDIDSRGALASSAGSPPPGMNRSFSEGMTLSQTGQVGPHPVTLTVKAIKNIRQKDIDPTVGTREITMRGEGRDDFGMTLAGANPVLVMSLLEGGPARKAGLMVNDMIVSVGGKDATKCAHSDISLLLIKASHSAHHKKSTGPSLALVTELTENLRRSPSTIRSRSKSPQPRPRVNVAAEDEPDLPVTSVDDLEPHGGLKTPQKKERSRSKSPVPRPRANLAPKDELDIPVTSIDDVDDHKPRRSRSKSPVPRPRVNRPPQDGTELTATSIDDPIGDLPGTEDEVLQRLEEAADLIKVAVEAGKPDLPAKPKSSSGDNTGKKLSSGPGLATLGVPSSKTGFGAKGKPPGSAPSSPGTRRRATQEMTFEEMAASSKSAPTSPGTQRRNKLKRSASSKGSAFIVEHKSGRMVGVTARKSILSGEDGEDGDDDQGRKRVLLSDSFEVTPAETLDLEAALGKASAKLFTKRESEDSTPSAIASPEIILTPSEVASPKKLSSSNLHGSRISNSNTHGQKESGPPAPKPRTPKVSSQMDNKITGLQQALMASPIHQTRLSTGARVSNTSQRSQSPQESQVKIEVQPPEKEIPSRKTSTTSVGKSVGRSKSMKTLSHKTSTSDFDAISSTATPSLGLTAGHAKRDIARGRSVRKPSRPKSVHAPATLGSEDLFVAEEVPAAVVNEKETSSSKGQTPNRKQGVWGANLTHVETNGGASPKTTPTAGVNLIVQARIQGGSPGGSPLRRSKRQSSAEIISGAKQNPSPAEDTSREKLLKTRSRSVPGLLDEKPESPAGEVSANTNGKAIPMKRRAKTGRADRAKDPSGDPTPASSEADGQQPMKPSVALKPIKGRKPVAPDATPTGAAPDWIALAKAKQKPT